MTGPERRPTTGPTSRSPVRVRYAETDQMGVVYYANYFVWFEIGRTDLLRTLGGTYRQLEAEGLSLPVIEASCQYAAPCLYDEELVVVTRGRLLSPIRVAFSYAVERAGRGGRGARAYRARRPRPRRTAAPVAGVPARSPDGRGRARPARVIQMRSMHALVTGTAGFIASHVSNLLLDHGATVHGVDAFTDYYPRPLKEANLATLTGPPGLHLHRGHGSKRPTSAPLLDGVTHVFHFAAQAGVRRSWGRDFRHYTVNNVEVTQRLLEAVASRNIERFLYASTSSVYGDLAPIPMREDVRVQPVSPYGVTKLAGEQLCFLYHVNYGVPTVALRLFTVYGPRQRPDMGFHRFLTAAHEGGSITLYGDGEQTRDFTYVGDVAEAARLGAVQGVPGRVYNIGGGSRVSVNEVLPAGRGDRRLPRVHRPPRPATRRHARHLRRHVARPRRAGLRAEDVAGRGARRRIRLAEAAARVPTPPPIPPDDACAPVRPSRRRPASSAGRPGVRPAAPRRRLRREGHQDSRPAPASRTSSSSSAATSRWRRRSGSRRVSSSRH